MLTSIVTATVKIRGTSAMTQSRKHDTPELEGESKPAYDVRTWRLRMHVEKDARGHETVVIPARGLHMAIMDAAKYSKRQIPGQGKATWTKKFESGISIIENPPLHIDPSTIQCIAINANSDGVRGSGKRVTRRFPIIPAGWETTFDVMILDPIIVEEVFGEMLEIAGMFIGLGQYRPQNSGTNGRFDVVGVEWSEDRQPRTRKAA